MRPQPVFERFIHACLPPWAASAEGGQNFVVQPKGHLLFGAAACGFAAPLACNGDARKHLVFTQRAFVFVLAVPNKVPPACAVLVAESSWLNVFKVIFKPIMVNLPFNPAGRAKDDDGAAHLVNSLPSGLPVVQTQTQKTAHAHARCARSPRRAEMDYKALSPRRQIQAGALTG